MKNKKVKIEEKLVKAKQQFACLALPKDRVKDILWSHLDQKDVTNASVARLNIGRELFKIKIYRLASASLIVISVLIVLGGTTVYAANQSLPGNIFYPVNRKIETWHIALIQNPIQKQRVRIIYLGKRGQEWEQLKKKNSNASMLTENEKAAFKNMNETFTITVNGLQQQKQLYINGIMVSNSEKAQFEQNLNDMNKIMAEHMKFIKSRESEIEEALATAQNDREELESLANAMNAEMSEHLQLMQAMHTSK